MQVRKDDIPSGRPKIIQYSNGGYIFDTDLYRVKNGSDV